MRTICSLILLLLGWNGLMAQPSGDSLSVTTATFSAGIGSTHVLDTYLSQEKFSGPGLTLLATRQWQRPDRRWCTFLQHQANSAFVEDRSGQREEMEFCYTLYYGRYRQWQWGKFDVLTGALAAATIGFLYNTSNSNNPAQARLSLQLMPSAVVTYHLARWAFRYEADLPLAGIAFSPNYGQSYYEIFSRGIYDHNLVPTTFVSAPNLRQMLSADFRVSRRLTLRLGYLGDYQQMHVNGLKSHIYTHHILLGIVSRFSKIRR